MAVKAAPRRKRWVEQVVALATSVLVIAALWALSSALPHTGWASALFFLIAIPLGVVVIDFYIAWVERVSFAEVNRVWLRALRSRFTRRPKAEFPGAIGQLRIPVPPRCSACPTLITPGGRAMFMLHGDLPGDDAQRGDMAMVVYCESCSRHIMGTVMPSIGGIFGARVEKPYDA